MIEGGTPTIFVSDMQRAVDFYTSTLGLAEHGTRLYLCETVEQATP